MWRDPADDRRCRRLAVRAAGRAGTASPGLRRRPRDRRRRAALPLRPTAAVQGLSARCGRPPRIWRSPTSPRSTNSTRGGTSALRPSGSIPPPAASFSPLATRSAPTRVVIATGGAPRRLPVTDGLLGVHVLRTLAQADALRADLTGGAEHVAVIGAGFIGAEVAATCRALGLDVAIVEAMPVPLAAALGPELGAVCAGLHATNGVTLFAGTTVVEWLTVADGAGRRRVTGLVLSDGRWLRADVVVVGIGMQPNSGWLADSGAGRRQRRPDRPRLRHRPAERRRRRRCRTTLEPRPRPTRAPGALDRRGGGPSDRGAQSARPAHGAACRQAELLLVRPVRHTHPVRRCAGAVRRDSIPRRRSGRRGLRCDLQPG